MQTAEAAHREHHDAADRAERLYEAFRPQIEAATESHMTAKLESVDYWRERLDGIESTEQVSRLLAEIMGGKLDRACNGILEAMADLTVDLARFQKGVREDLREECEEQAEREVLP